MLSIILISSLLLFAFSVSRRKHHQTRWCFAVIGLFNLLVIEVVCYIYFLFLVSQGSSFFLIGHQMFLDKIIRHNILNTLAIDEKNPNSVFRLDPRLGYAPSKNKVIYQYKNLSSQGLRADRNYTVIPPDNKLRLAVFGDSFVYCDGEITQNCWPYFMEKSIKNLEVLNFGVSGYGLGQSYLRYINDGLRFKPDIILFNYVAVTNRDKVANRAIAAGKSLRNADAYRILFGIEEGILISKNMTPLDLFNKKFRWKLIYQPLGINPRDPLLNWDILSVPNIGLFTKVFLAQKKFAKVSRAKSPADDILNLKIIQNLLNIAEINDAHVIFFVEVEFQNLPRALQNILKQHQSHVTYVYSPSLLDRYSQGRERKDLLNTTNHYNAQGNLIYAHAVASLLEGRVWGEGNRKFKFDPEQNAFIRVEP